eukprot:136557-Ditylum_brightwellii.AAC.1
MDFTKVCKDYGIKSNPTVVKNHQTNVIIKRLHQVVGNMICMQALEKRSFTKDDSWGEVLASSARAIRSTYHNLLGATPRQLVFGRDML